MSEFHRITVQFNVMSTPTKMVRAITTKTVRVAIYLRVSLDPTGDEESVARQEKACRAIVAQRPGWVVVMTYKDNSVSAYSRSAKREHYDEMVAAYGRGEFEAIVCYDLDRLTRQPRQLEDWIDAAESKGLLLVTANGEADLSNDNGRLFARLKAAVARSEVERKGKRQQLAAVQRSELGRIPKGARLFGYTTDGQLMVTEAKVVREIFTAFKAGTSLREISRGLTERGIPTRGGKAWHPSTVLGILRNPRYAGRSIYLGAVVADVKGEWPQLVPDGMFDEVAARLADPRRKTSKIGTDRRHLGSSLYLCGVCDAPLRSHTGNRYHCPAGHLTRAGEHIDSYVVRLVRERLADPDLVAKVAARTQADPKAVETVARLRGRLVRIESDYDAELIDGRRYATATAKVKAELATALGELARVTTGSAAAATIGAADPVAAFDAGTLGARRAVVEFLLSVKVNPAPRGRRLPAGEDARIDAAADSLEIDWH